MARRAGSHAQCASGACRGDLTPTHPTCGKCAKPPAVGGKCPCTTDNLSEWETALRCDETSKVCVIADGEGTPCEPSAFTCQRALSCVDGRCSLTHPFTSRVSLGEVCDRVRDDIYPPRACGGGTWCSNARICTPTLKLGERCGIADGEPFACGWDAVCTSLPSGATCRAIDDLCR